MATAPFDPNGFATWSDENNKEFQVADASSPLPKTKNFQTPANTPDYFTEESTPFLKPGEPQPVKNPQDFNKDIANAQAARQTEAPQQTETPERAAALLQAWGGAPPPATGMEPAAPAADPAVTGWAELNSKWNTKDDGHAGATERYPGVVANESALSGISAFFSKAASPTVRGIADSLGFTGGVAANGPAGLAKHLIYDSIVNFYQNQNYDSRGALEATKQAAMSSLTEIDTKSKEIRKLMGKVGINTSLNEEKGDHSGSARWADSLAYALGSSIPFMPIGAAPAAVNAIGRGAMPVIMAGLRSIAKDSGLSLFAGGLGREFADSVTGTEGSKKVAEAAGNVAGSLAGPKVMGLTAAGAAGGLAAAKILATGLFIGMERSGSVAFNNLIGHMSASQIARGLADNPELAAKNALAGAGVQGLGGQLPGGFSVLPPLASADLSVQALMHQVIQKDRMANHAYREVLQANDDVLKGFSSNQSIEQSAGDVNAHLATLQQSRIDAKQAMIKQATDQAENDFAVATRNSRMNPEDSKAAALAFEAANRARLIEAYETASAATRQDFATARMAGLDSTAVDTTRLYDRLSDMISQGIEKYGTAEHHFPTKVVSQMYQKNPIAMFDSHGVPVRGHLENYTLGSKEPWGRIQGIYNDVDFAIQNEMRVGRDPVKLDYLFRIQDEVLQALKTIHYPQGIPAGAKLGVLPEGGLPQLLQNAINSHQENMRLFVNSPVGKVLGLNRPGFSDQPIQDIRRWLGNTPETQQKIQSMFDAVAERGGVAAGVHPADAMIQDMKSMLRQEFADAYRTGGQKNSEKWVIDNHAMLTHPAFSDIQKEFRSALNSRSVAETMGTQATADVDEIRKSRATLFMNSDPETAFQAALSGNNKFTATQEIIKDLKLDPTGRALQGFANMAFDRMMAITSNANLLNEPGKTFSWGKEAESYMRNNKGMFSAIDREIPGYQKRMEQFIEGIKMQERALTKPNIPLNAKTVEFSLTGMGAIGAAIVGAKVGRAMETGTIQVPGIMRNLFVQVYSHIASKVPAMEAQKLLSRGMIEPDVFQQLMAPIRTQQDVERLSMFLAPYMLSAPSVIYNTGQQKANPQPPMMDKE